MQHQKNSIVREVGKLTFALITRHLFVRQFPWQLVYPPAIQQYNSYFG